MITFDLVVVALHTYVVTHTTRLRLRLLPRFGCHTRLLRLRTLPHATLRCLPRTHTTLVIYRWLIPVTLRLPFGCRSTVTVLDCVCYHRITRYLRLPVTFWVVITVYGCSRITTFTAVRLRTFTLITRVVTLLGCYVTTRYRSRFYYRMRLHAHAGYVARLYLLRLICYTFVVVYCLHCPTLLHYDLLIYTPFI